MFAFVFAQICDVVVIILAVLGARSQKKTTTLFYGIIGNLILTLEYTLLGALTGTAIVFLNGTRCFVFFMFAKYNKKPSIFVLLIFEVLNVVLGIIAWQSLWSLLVIVGTVLYTYGLWQNNIVVLKVLTAINTGLWAIYNFVVLAYVGVVRSVAECISAVSAVISIKKREKLQKMQKNEQNLIKNEDFDKIA